MSQQQRLTVNTTIVSSIPTRGNDCRSGNKTKCDVEMRYSTVGRKVHRNVLTVNTRFSLSPRIARKNLYLITTKQIYEKTSQNLKQIKTT